MGVITPQILHQKFLTYPHEHALLQHKLIELVDAYVFVLIP